jgi:hypothetical protein
LASLSRESLAKDPGDLAAERTEKASAAGVAVNVIRGWLGHVSLETTNRYAEITAKMKEAAFKTLRAIHRGSRRSAKPSMAG